MCQVIFYFPRNLKDILVPRNLKDILVHWQQAALIIQALDLADKVKGWFASINTYMGDWSYTFSLLWAWTYSRRESVQSKILKNVDPQIFRKTPLNKSWIRLYSCNNNSYIMSMMFICTHFLYRIAQLMKY